MKSVKKIVKKRVHEEGYKIIILTALILVALVLLLNLLCAHQTAWHVITYVMLGLYMFWTICFFRLPIRETNRTDNAVIAPADGEVVANEIVYEDEYFKKEMRLVSIFMSIYNAHINFYPISGTVSYRQYHPGKFIVAWKPKSSVENERNTVVIRDNNGREVLSRQIAGFVARRIVCDVVPGEYAEVGDEFGLIRFGSRVDVFMPVDSDVKVKIGDKTRGKLTVLAELK